MLLVGDEGALHWVEGVGRCSQGPSHVAVSTCLLEVGVDDVLGVDVDHRLRHIKQHVEDHVLQQQGVAGGDSRLARPPCHP